jgi:hypothetical protein
MPNCPSLSEELRPNWRLVAPASETEVERLPGVDDIAVRSQEVGKLEIDIADFRSGTLATSVAFHIEEEEIAWTELAGKGQLVAV